MTISSHYGKAKVLGNIYFYIKAASYRHRRSDPPSSAAILLWKTNTKSCRWPQADRGMSKLLNCHSGESKIEEGCCGGSTRGRRAGGNKGRCHNNQHPADGGVLSRTVGDGWWHQRSSGSRPLTLAVQGEPGGSRGAAVFSVCNIKSHKKQTLVQQVRNMAASYSDIFRFIFMPFRSNLQSHAGSALIFGECLLDARSQS